MYINNVKKYRKYTGDRMFILMDDIHLLIINVVKSSRSITSKRHNYRWYTKM